MKQLIKLSFLFLLMATFGCDADGNHVDCTTPPERFIFEFIDKDTGKNLFATGDFDVTKPVIIVDLTTGKVIQTLYVKSDNLYRIVIDSIGWQTGVFNYSINYDGKSVLELHVSAERVSKNHCNFTRIKSVEFNKTGIELDKTTGVYKIPFTAAE